jgi:hypothetical protein
MLVEFQDSTSKEHYAFMKNVVIRLLITRARVEMHRIRNNKKTQDISCNYGTC